MGNRAGRRPVRLLDLFCGAGGAAMGYHRAGFEVVGVDIKAQKHYPFEFHQGDAMEWPLDGFDAIHASPPCQAYSRSGGERRRHDHPDLVDAVRARLQAARVPYAIENIPGSPLVNAVLLCGATFNLPIIRHRLFEVEPWTLVPTLCNATSSNGTTDHGPGYHPYAHRDWEHAWRREVLPVVWPWMTLVESRQAIPPAYTEWIGAHLMEALTGYRRLAWDLPA